MVAIVGKRTIDCGVTQDSVINLMIDLEGGAKKRKKKTYTTPKVR